MFASPLFWQIRYLVTNLSKKNLKSSISELNQLIELYGEDARLFFLQCLVEETGFKEQKAHAHHGNKDAQKIQLLQHEIAQAAEEPNFVSAICRALEGSGGAGRERAEQPHGRQSGRGGVQGQQGPHRITEEFLVGFCRALKLSPAQQVAVGLGLSRSPNPGVAKEGVKFLVARVPSLGGTAVGGAGGAGAGVGQLSLEALHSLFELVNSSEEVCAQPQLAKLLLQQIREAHQELLGGLEGGKGAGGGPTCADETRSGTTRSGGASSAGSKSGAGSEAVSLAPSQGFVAALFEGDALALVPLFTDHTGEMNFLSKTSGAMSLTSDVAGIANSIGQGGSLAGFLKDLGHTCCSRPEALRHAIRESAVVVDERQVAHLITMLANNYNIPKGGGDDGDLSSAMTNSLFSSGEGQMAADAGRDGGGSAGQGQGLWKLEVARQVLAEDYGPRLDWVAVARALDHDRFNIPDQNAFRVLLALYRGPAGRDIPPDALYMPWENRRGQLSFLRAAIQAPPQVFTFGSSPAKQAPLEDVDPSAATPNAAWLSLDLVAALLSLASDTELYAQVRDVFSKPAYQCPELLLLALAAVPSEAGGSLRVEMLSRLLPLYFRPNRNTHAASLIRRLWQVNPRLVVQSGVKAFNVDSTLPSVVYVLRIMRLVPDCAVELLASEDCAFAIAVASVAFGAEVSSSETQPVSALPTLELEKWVCERLSRKDREMFAAKMVSFVQLHLPTARLRHEAQKPGETAEEGPLPTCAMSIEAAAIFIKVLGGTGKAAPAAEPLLKKNPALLQSATQLFEAAKILYPGMHHVMDTEEEVEDIANAYFQRIYTSEQSIEEVIVMLQRFKSSSDPRELEIFACMVHNLFDEYRFYHNYPEPELRITGILFGSLIQHQLVSSITLGIALRYVLEALRKPPKPDAKGRMFRFGMFALEQFKGRLGEWPQYCSHMIQIPHLLANHPRLVQEIEESMQRPPERLPPTAVAPGPPKVSVPDGPRQLPQILPVGGGLVRQGSAPGPEASGGGGGGGGGPAGAIGASPVMRAQPTRSISQGQGTPDRNVAGGMSSIGRSPGAQGLAGNDQVLQGHGMGGLGGILDGMSTRQGAAAAGVGGAGPTGAQLQGAGASHPGQIGSQQQQGGGGAGGGSAPSTGGAMQQLEGLQLQQQQQQQQVVAGASSRSPTGPAPAQHSSFGGTGQPASAAASATGGVGAASAFGGGGGGAAPATGADGKGGAGGTGAVGRLGRELGLASVLGLSQQGQEQTRLGGQQAGVPAMGNVGGGVAAGAPGHETWGTGAGGQALPQAGGLATAPAANNGPGGAGAVPTGALPPKQPEGLGTPNMDQLMAKVEEPTALTNPPEIVMDRIHFVVNNVTANNLPQKVEQIKSDVQDNPDYHPWLANYLVVKRICTQPNFHDLYLELVNQLETPPLMDAILRNVFYNISKLLRSQKIITSTSERSLLKNLGSWLGKITLGRDKPVLQRELDMKELLFQGYETGRLIAVTPFVAKILEGAPSGKSRVFKPPNPWIMGLFSALHEMYELQDLKMNIKFEIEMLCQKFNVTLADVPMYGRLSTRMTPSKEKNPDFNSRARAEAANAQQSQDAAAAAAAAAAAGDGAAGGGGADGGVRDGEGRGAAGTGDGRGGTRDGEGRPGATGVKQPADQQTVIPNLAAYVTINPNLEIFASQPQLKDVLKRVVPVAVDRAIREIIQPVVERSVTIACITSKELVQKDFAMEADENKMRKAAHLMVSNLAGSLALVTCKEPLRVSIGNHMRSLLAAGAPLADQATTEMLVQLCSSENLELGCMLIEKAATEKAMRDIDEAVAGSLQQRRKSRETTGQPFYDMTIFNSLRYPGALPEALRPKPGGLHPQQLLVYEAFQRVPRQPTVNRSPAGPSGLAGPSNAGGPAPTSPASPAVNNMGGGVVPARAAASPTGVELTLEQALQAWQGAITRLDMAIGGLLRRAGGGPELTLHAANRDQDLSAALQEIVTVGKSVPVTSREEALTKFARAVFGRLFDMARGKEDNPAAVPMLRVEVYAAVLELCLRTVKTSLSGGRKEDLLSQWYTSLPPAALVGSGSRKLHLGAMKYLVQMNMVDLEKTDAFLARNISLQNQNQQMAASPEQLQLQDEWGLYAIDLIRQCVFEHTDASGADGKVYQVATMKSFAKSLETLSQLNESKRPLLAQQFLQLASELRIATHPDTRKIGGADGKSPSMLGIKAPMGSPVVQPRAPGGGMGVVMPGRNDPVGTREEVTQLLNYWLRFCNENPVSDEKTAPAMLQVLAQRKTLLTDESTDRFLRVATELVVEACLKSSRPSTPTAAAGAGADDKAKANSNTPQLSYAVVDPYVRLLVMLIRSKKATDPSVAVNQRLAMLNKVLSTVVRVLMQDVEAKKAATEAPVSSSPGGGSSNSGAFDQRPYFRILLCMVKDMNKPNRHLDNSNLQVLAAFASAFHALQPAACPVFAFAWLELVSHRNFMPNLLLVKQNKGWSNMHRLLVDLLIFMEPHLRRPSLLEAVRLLYTGMLRTLLVLLHDFPEFLCDYHLSFCDVIPPSCIQLRNLVLSAFPRSMRLPDPFTPNLKVDLLPEIALAPRVLSNYVAALSHNGIRGDLDKFLLTRHQPLHFLAELAGKLRLSPQEAAHTGMTYNVACINALVVYVGSQAILQLNNKTPVITHSAPMDVFHQLANKLDPEGRYFFLNAVANQLRYPNQHTHYFSCVLLYLFAEAQSEMVQEQITRILLERLIVHRPHPWGVLITFIELIKNPRYSFWSHSFTHCAPELERVFESVARSCMTPGAAGAGAGAEDDGVAAGTAQ